MDDLLRPDGFLNEVFGPELDGADCDTHAAEAGHDHKRGASASGPHAVEKVQARAVWESEVGQHQPKLSCHGGPFGLTHGRGGGDSESLEPQYSGQSQQTTLVIVDDQNARRLQQGEADVNALKAPTTRLEQWLFATWSGKPIAPNNVLRSAIAPACERLGLPRATWLTFRRTYSSWAHDKGVPGKVIAQLMGHAKVDTTLNVYVQVLDDSVREAAQLVGNRLFTIVHKTGKAGLATH